jgi:hypothetical protein
MIEIAEQSTAEQKLNFDLKGKIVVADDQHINIETLKQHTLNLQIDENTIFCVNG